jgi:hypothetical protein
MVCVRSRTIGEEEVDRTTTRRHEKKIDFEGKVYPKKKTFEPCTHFSQK